MTNQYVPDIAPLGAGDIARSADVNDRYANMVSGFDRLPPPKDGEQGFSAPVPVGEPVNDDHAATKNFVETAASSQVAQAAASATSAESSASAAQDSQNAAAASATSAANNAGVTNVKAAEAATSASNAAASEDAAANSASSASSSASSASNSATSASNSASSAASSATIAQSAETNAVAAFDQFEDRYLGAKASDPTVDNDGEALITGALYFDTNTNNMKVYNGSIWRIAYVPPELLTFDAVTDAGNTTTNAITVGPFTSTNADVNLTNLATTTSTTDPVIAVDGDGRLQKRTLGSLAYSSATFDNYVSWNFNATTTEQITKGETVTFQGGGSTTVSNSGNTITISSSDTNTTNFNIQASSGTPTNISAGETINFTGTGGATVTRAGNTITIDTTDGGLDAIVFDTTPQLGGTLDANGNSIDMGTNTITDAKVGQWDAAYGDKVNTVSFDTNSGILTLNRQDGGTVSRDLDGRYPLNNGTGATGTWGVSISGNAATATTASAVPFSGVSGKPTTLAGYNITDEVYKKGTDIPGSADLNSYTTSGFYHQNSNANAQSGVNYPTGNAGMLEVTADGSMVYQRYTLYNSGQIYTRSYYQGTWYAWRLVRDSANSLSVSSGEKSNWNAAYNDKINSASFNTTNGVITLTQQDGGTVTVDIDGRYARTNTTYSAGTGLSLSSGTTFNLNFAELTDMTADISGTTEFILQNGNTESRKAASEIKLSAFNNDANWTANVGDITAVNVSAPLTGGGTSGSVSIGLSTTGLAAGTYGSTANSTKIDTITLDAFGRVTAVATGDLGTFTETDPVFTASPANGITSTNITNWNTAYNDKINSVGWANGTLTFNQQDGTTLSQSLDGRYAYASTALTTSTSFSGDVTGKYNTISVVNDSHTHTSSTISDATSSNTANTIVKRDANGDVVLRYLNSSYVNMTHASSTRASDTVFYSSSDNFIRKNSADGMRSSLNVPTRTGGNASGTWGISITGSAASATTATSATSATNATNATNFNVAADNGTNATHYPVFVGGATGNQRPNSDTAFTYNPQSNTLTAGTFSGSLSGNATTATTATSATNATNVNVLADNSTNATHYPLFVGGTGNQRPNRDTSLTYNPSSNTLTLGTLGATTGSFGGNVTVSGTLSVRTAIDLADNDTLRFGSGDDCELFCNGSHMYMDLNAGIGNFYIRDGSTTRFTFDDAGSFAATGNITAYSDARLKDNVETLDGSKVYEMRGVSFTKDGEAGSGVIAQELQKVAPELVHENEEYLSVAYGNLVGYLIEAVKSQKAVIDELTARIEALEAK